MLSNAHLLRNVKRGVRLLSPLGDGALPGMVKPPYNLDAERTHAFPFPFGARSAAELMTPAQESAVAGWSSILGLAAVSAWLAYRK